MFNKLERTKTMNKGGTGLGLVISNGLVKRLGDDTNKGIKVESEIDVGTTFSFTLENKQFSEEQLNLEERVIIDRPLVTVYNESRIQRLNLRISSGDKDCKCPKILIVDDNEYNIYCLNMLLKNQEFECEYTNNGRDAIEMV